MKLLTMLMMAANPGGESLPDVVLLDFTAGYCQPCQEMVPRLQRMESDGFPVRRIDITQDPETSRRYKVDRIPTLILLVEGKEQKRFVGLTSEQELRQVMNDAARKLDSVRNTAAEPAMAASDESPREVEAAESTREFDVEGDPSPASPVTAEEPKRKGLGAIFAHIREGLTGSRSQPPRFEHPTFRGQSPDSDGSAGSRNPLPMQASVRVTVRDGRNQDFGTGTIVHSVPGKSMVLTCAHLFHNVSKDAITKVELFKDGRAVSYPAKVVGGDRESDLAMLQISTVSALPVSPIVGPDRQLLEGDDVFSVGCSNGGPPSTLSMKVVSLNRYLGPSNIVCTLIPQKGRSGGGLFNQDGELIGVCSAADREQNEGLYMASVAIRRLITDLNLQALFDGRPVPAFENSVAEASREPAGPFAEFEDAELFDQIFNEEVAVPAEKPTPVAVSRHEQAPPIDSADPFGSHETLRDAVAQVAPTAVSAAANAVAGSNLAPQEITVIIDSKDPSRGKQVIVIPRPSPWLVQLLTGEPPTGDHGMTTARNTNIRSAATASQVSLRNSAPRAKAFPVAGP
ncbi:MAG: trypsin-like peptidase domain-containing protein [Planctomycetaceae bacterium]